ncbi:hypothetical protein C8Q80DRAFT_519590 [Daedaleopsis nitida]|nr:hypothetical protein C8Q80DRAFT_519590 [Daedaleopsis nitida]
MPSSSIHRSCDSRRTRHSTPAAAQTKRPTSLPATTADSVRAAATYPYGWRTGNHRATTLCLHDFAACLCLCLCFCLCLCLCSLSPSLFSVLYPVALCFVYALPGRDGGLGRRRAYGTTAPRLLRWRPRSGATTTATRRCAAALCAARARFGKDSRVTRRPGPALPHEDGSGWRGAERRGRCVPESKGESAMRARMRKGTGMGPLPCIGAVKVRYRPRRRGVAEGRASRRPLAEGRTPARREVGSMQAGRVSALRVCCVCDG